jgi:hypothetical protein
MTGSTSINRSLKLNTNLPIFFTMPIVLFGLGGVNPRILSKDFFITGTKFSILGFTFKTFVTLVEDFSFLMRFALSYLLISFIIFLSVVKFIGSFPLSSNIL